MSKLACKQISYVLIAVFALIAVPAWAQEEGPQQERPELTERIFTIRHADVGEIYRIVRSLVTRYATVVANEGSSIIVVQDTAETISRIEAIIAEIDLPPDNIRLTFFVFTASKEEGEEIPDNLPEGVRRGLVELGNVMAYKSFQLIDRGMLTLASTARRGDLTIFSDRGYEIGISFEPKYNLQSKFLRLEELRLIIKRGESVSQLMRTDIGVENGGVSVVGASKMDGGEEALMAIVSMNAESVGQ